MTILWPKVISVGLLFGYLAGAAAQSRHLGEPLALPSIAFASDEGSDGYIHFQQTLTFDGTKLECRTNYSTDQGIQIEQLDNEPPCHALWLSAWMQVFLGRRCGPQTAKRYQANAVLQFNEQCVCLQIYETTTMQKHGLRLVNQVALEPEQCLSLATPEMKEAYRLAKEKTDLITNEVASRKAAENH